MFLIVFFFIFWWNFLPLDKFYICGLPWYHILTAKNFGHILSVISFARHCHNFKNVYIFFISFMCKTHCFIVSKVILCDVCSFFLTVVFHRSGRFIYMISFQWNKKTLKVPQFFALWKESLNNDGQQFLQYQQIEQSLLTEPKIK